MKTNIYDEVQEERELSKNAHGAFVRRVVERLEHDRGYRLDSYESRPVWPNPNNLNFGRKHDALMTTKSSNWVGVEVLNHIVADAEEASDLRDKALDTKCKLIIVAALEYTQSFIDYCTKHKIEAFVVSNRSKLGHLKLKKVA